MNALWVKVLTVLALLAAAVLPCAAEEPTPWPQAAEEARQTGAALVEEYRQARHVTAAELQAAEAEHARLRAAVAAAEQALKAQQAQLAELQQQTAAARAALGADERDLQAVRVVVQTAESETVQLLDKAPLTVALRGPLLDGIDAAEGTLGFPRIARLVTTLQAVIDGTGGVQRTEATVAGDDGVPRPLPVVHVGPFLSLAAADDGPVFLRPGDAGVLRLAERRPDRNEREALQPLFTDTAAILPVDLSGGAALTGGVVTGLAGRLQTGGVLVWPILAIGVVALLLVVERAFRFARLRTDSTGLVQAVRQRLQAGDLAGSRELCRSQRRQPAAAVLAAGLDHAGHGLESVENAFHEAILRQIPALERFLPTLSVLGAVAPLLGLLGTVSGMIGTFQALTSVAERQTGLVSAGISEALITTQLGLAVAIPVILLHHLLERRMERIVDQMEAAAVALTPQLAAQSVSEEDRCLRS